MSSKGNAVGGIRILPGSGVRQAFGLWTPTDVSGAGLTLTPFGNVYFVKTGRIVWITAALSWPVTANASPVRIGGLPFLPLNNNGNAVVAAGSPYVAPIGGYVWAYLNGPNNWVELYYDNFAGGAALTNALASANFFRFSLSYLSAS